MRKIKDELVKKLIRLNLTKAELITILELIQFADEKGEICVHYTLVANELGYCNATFYNCLHNLQDYGLISFEKNKKCKDEIFISIPANNFVKSGYKNYIDINNSFFESRKYLQLKAGAIRLMLYLIFRVLKAKYSRDAKSSLHKKNKLNFNNSYDTIAKKLNITKRMTKIYFEDLKKNDLISIGLKKLVFAQKAHDVVTVNHSSLERAKVILTEKGHEIEQDSNCLHSHFRFVVLSFCRRKKVAIVDDLNLNNAAALMIQYREKCENNGKDIYNLTFDSIMQLAEKNSVLNSKIMHYILKILVSKDYTESLIF